MMTSRQRGLFLLGALSLTVLILWAGRRSGSTTASPSASSNEQSQVAAQTPERAIPAVSTLHRQETSAYQARLFADEDGAVLVTQAGFTIFRRAEAAEERAIPLGPIAVRQGGSIVFWRSGRLRQISLSGEDERDVAALTRAPQYLLASESRLGWIHVDQENGASLQTLSAGDVRVVYETQDRVCASVMRDTVVYWVLQSRDGTWKVGSIGLDGQHRMLTGAHEGRPPAMLAVGADGLYFYDGPERGVRKLSFALDREDAVLTNVICSPLAVSDRVICAHVGGLFDIAPRGLAPRILASEGSGPITAVAATHDRVFWVAEAGDARLIVRTVPLSRL